MASYQHNGVNVLCNKNRSDDNVNEIHVHFVPWTELILWSTIVINGSSFIRPSIVHTVCTYGIWGSVIRSHLRLFTQKIISRSNDKTHLGHLFLVVWKIFHNVFEKFHSIEPWNGFRHRIGKKNSTVVSQKQLYVVCTRPTARPNRTRRERKATQMSAIEQCRHFEKIHTHTQNTSKVVGSAKTLSNIK